MVEALIVVIGLLLAERGFYAHTQAKVTFRHLNMIAAKTPYELALLNKVDEAPTPKAPKGSQESEIITPIGV